MDGLSSIYYPFEGFGHRFGMEARNCRETYDISVAQGSLFAGAVDTILDDPDLFFWTFCIALDLHKGISDGIFSVSINENDLVVEGKEHVISDVKKFINEMRPFFLKAKKSITPIYALQVKVTIDIFLKSPSEEIDLIGWLDDEQHPAKIYEFWFNSFIKPVMSTLAQSLGFRCSNVIIRGQKIKKERFRDERPQNVAAFKIERH